MSDSPFKFQEEIYLGEMLAYVHSTYDQHYSKGKIQATEDIIDDGWGEGFCIGNSKKYLKRYGKKGETHEEWRKDIIKNIHYSLILLHIHDKKYREQQQQEFADPELYAAKVSKSLDRQEGG